MTIRKLTDYFKEVRKDEVLNTERITDLVNEMEYKVITEIFSTHEGMPHRARHFRGHSDDTSYDDYRDDELLIHAPYDNIYRLYIQWQTDMRENDIIDASNSQRLFYSAYYDFEKKWNNTHMPICKVKYGSYY